MTNAVATPEAPVVDAPVADAPVAQASDKYATDAQRETLSKGVLAARQAGFSRTQLQELTELTPAQLWRIEQGNAHKHEVDQVEVALAQIESGDVQPPARKGKIGKAQAKINAALSILLSANEKLTKAQLVDVVSQAVEALNASDEDAPAESPSE